MGPLQDGTGNDEGRQEAGQWGRGERQGSSGQRLTRMDDWMGQGGKRMGRKGAGGGGGGGEARKRRRWQRTEPDEGHRAGQHIQGAGGAGRDSKGKGQQGREEWQRSTGRRQTAGRMTAGTGRDGGRAAERGDTEGQQEMRQRYYGTGNDEGRDGNARKAEAGGGATGRGERGGQEEEGIEQAGTA